jgi:PAS domain-containing protein
MIGELELLRLIDLIYQGALDGQTWPFLVQSVAELLGGRTAGLGIHDRRAGALRAPVFFEVEPAYQRTYAALITRSDMAGWWRWVADNAAAKAFTDGAEYRDSGIGNTKLYAEWLQPQQMDHGLTAPLLDATSFAGGLFITRPAEAGPFEDDQIVTLAALQPHLLRAVQVRLQAVETAKQQALESLDRLEQGVLLVDAQAALLHANRAAALVLGGGQGLMTGRGVLACDHADDTARLRRLIGEASTGGGRFRSSWRRCVASIRYCSNRTRRPSCS